METKRTTERVTCPKCDGAGTLTWTSYANGVCFECAGSKKITVEAFSASQVVRGMVNNLGYTADGIMQHASEMGG